MGSFGLRRLAGWQVVCSDIGRSVCSTIELLPFFLE